MTYDQQLAIERDYDYQSFQQSQKYWRQRARKHPILLSLRDAYLKVGGDIPTLHKFIKALSTEDRMNFLKATPEQAKEMFTFWGTNWGTK